MSAKDGGPAFPGIIDSFAASDEYQNHYTGLNTHDGMSLRDFFAASALQGMLANSGYHFDGQPDIGDRSHLAYAYADAMLAEREKQKP